MIRAYVTDVFDDLHIVLHPFRKEMVSLSFYFPISIQSVNIWKG